MNFQKVRRLRTHIKLVETAIVVNAVAFIICVALLAGHMLGFYILPRHGIFWVVLGVLSSIVSAFALLSLRSDLQKEWKKELMP